ncbi:MAG: histidine phosphatase family protein [Lachnospiraceae bacterium]|nr:histidine phosphatase family protein [Lachnospiraceae bacterium]
MKLYFIRHGKTPGNEEHRYIGRTDEGLSPAGEAMIRQLGAYMRRLSLPILSSVVGAETGARPGGQARGSADESLSRVTCPAEKSKGQASDLSDLRIVTSPMRRCRETAAILFPEHHFLEMADLREYDFGRFEYKNYEELKDDPVYADWLEAGGAKPFPEGEGLDHFKARICRAFDESLEAIKKSNTKAAVFVVHGGSIMSILERYDEQKLGYYDYQRPNGALLEADWDETYPVVLRNLKTYRED